MTTLSEQIGLSFWSNVEAYKEQNYKWMLNHKDLATHAVTLTHDPSKIHAFLNRYSMKMDFNDPYLIKKYKREMHYFGKLLSKSLFGKSAQRYGEKLLLIPILEGIEKDAFPHYHCTIGVDPKRVDIASEKIVSCWQQTRFSGYHNEVKLYRDEGWFSYSTKRCMFPSKEVIDWENVLLPSSSQSIPG